MATVTHNLLKRASSPINATVKTSEDNSLEMYGLILGLVVNGMEPGDRLFTNAVNNYFLFSDNEIIDGSTLAKIVEEGLNVKEKITEFSIQDLHIPDQSNPTSQRLRGLQELSQGLAYGLCIKSSDGSFIESKEHPFLDEINTIYEITKIDTDDDIDENDLNEVLNYLVSTIKTISHNTQ
jgi:uncharacterized protein YgfB (UPF0149 family)